MDASNVRAVRRELRRNKIDGVTPSIETLRLADELGVDPNPPKPKPEPKRAKKAAAKKK